MILAMFAAAMSFQPAELAPPPEVEQATDELGECLSAGIDNADERAAPQVVARSIISNCQALLTQATDAHARWVQSSNMSTAEKQEALQAGRRSAAGLEAQITQAIRAGRAD